MTTNPGAQAHKKAPRRHRGPRKVTAKRLRNKALSHLERYDLSAWRLESYLKRWAAKSCRAHDTSYEEAAEIIEKLIAELTELGLLNDRRHAVSRVSSLSRAGKSKRFVTAKLTQDGLAQNDIDAGFAALLEEQGEEAEFIAAIRLARKRRLGPFASNPKEREARRERHLATLARGGFSYDIALRIIEAEEVDELEQMIPIGL